MIHVLLLVVAMLALGCSDDQPTNTSDNASTSGIYFYDAGSEYRYIEVPSSGVAVFRSRVSKDYDLRRLESDNYCYFVPTRFIARTGKERWMKVYNEDLYLQTATQGAGGEIFLSYDEESQPEMDDESFMFIIHEFGTVGDRASVAVESVAHPGYFFTHEGHLLTGNGIALKPFDSPEKAPRWLVNHDPNVTEIGGLD